MQLLQGVWDAVAAAVDVDAWWTTHGGFVGAAAGVALAVLHAATAAAARDVADPDHGVTALEVLLLAVAVANAVALFYWQVRTYQLFPRPGDPQLTWTSPRRSRNADIIAVSRDERQTLPTLWNLVWALLRRPSPLPDDATLAWQLRVWDPKPASKQLFLCYSPAHAVALMFADRPAHLVTLVAISCALWWLDTFYAQQAWDRQLLFDEVYNIQLAAAADRPARPEWKVYWQSPQAQRRKPLDDGGVPAAHNGDEADGDNDESAETPPRIRRRHH